MPLILVCAILQVCNTGNLQEGATVFADHFAACKTRSDGRAALKAPLFAPAELP